ncbi:hypothetical protein M432DRAFT_670177 [Thermoascus aurantiacus ATCC 26904]
MQDDVPTPSPPQAVKAENSSLRRLDFLFPDCMPGPAGRESIGVFLRYAITSYTYLMDGSGALNSSEDEYKPPLYHGAALGFHLSISKIIDDDNEEEEPVSLPPPQRKGKKSRCAGRRGGSGRTLPQASGKAGPEYRVKKRQHNASWGARSPAVQDDEEFCPQFFNKIGRVCENTLFDIGFLADFVLVEVQDTSLATVSPLQDLLLQRSGAAFHAEIRGSRLDQQTEIASSDLPKECLYPSLYTQWMQISAFDQSDKPEAIYKRRRNWNTFPNLT